MLNKLTVSELAELSKLSKAYISQVKHGKRPPSKKLMEALDELGAQNRNDLVDTNIALQLFLKSRREGISPSTIRDYNGALRRALPVLGLAPTAQRVNRFFSSLSCSLGGKYGYYKDIRAFYNWLYSPRSGLAFRQESNPITWVDAPKRPQLILPSLSHEQVLGLLEAAQNQRDKAIIALFTESGLRLAELTNIGLQDIDWGNHTVRVMGKGRKKPMPHLVSYQSSI
ncbi:tyrosine-type recombinase/integrase [Chloroflexota bacterium]